MIRPMMQAFIRYAPYLSLAIALAIGYLSLSPLEDLPPVPGGDKLHHFVAYACLTFPMMFADARDWRRIMVPAIIYGGAIELIQPYVNRYGEWLDFAANTAGCLIGAGLALLASRLLARPKLPRLKA